MSTIPDSTRQATTDDEYDRPPLDAIITPRCRVEFGGRIFSDNEDLRAAMEAAVHRPEPRGAAATPSLHHARSPRRRLSRREKP